MQSYIMNHFQARFQEHCPPWWLRLPRWALVIWASAVTNALVFFAAWALGFVSRGQDLPTPLGEQGLSAPLVMISSAVGAGGAMVVYALINRISRRPVRLYRIVSTVVLGISMLMPLSIVGASTALILTLEIIHVVVWAVSLNGLMAQGRDVGR